jgi:hypothetical protein
MPGLPQAISALIGTVQGLFVAGGFFTTTAGRIAVGLALNAGAEALRRANAPDRAAPSPAERLVSVSQPLTEMRLVLGRTRLGGPKGVDQKANGSRHYTVLLAGHPIGGVRSIWLDRTEQVLEADGEVSGTPQAGYANLRVYTGAAGQTADPVLVANLPDVTTAFDFAGLAHVAVTARNAPAELMQTVYPNGRHWDVSALVDGAADVLDPRTGRRGHSRNAALLFAWLCERRGVPTDPAEIARAADLCDRPVTDRHGVTRARWTFDHVFEDGQDLETMLKEIEVACDGYRYERSDGSYGFIPGGWIPPSVTLTARSLRRLRVRESRSQVGDKAVTEAVVKYTSPDHEYLDQPTGTWVADASAVPNRLTFEAFGVDSHNQAWRLAVRALARRRARYEVEAEIGPLRYLELIRAREGDGSGRFVRLVHEELGRDIFVEIERLVLAGDGRSATLSGVSVDPAEFDPDAALEPDVPERAARATGGEPVPVGLTVVALDGSTVRASWPAQPSGYSLELDWRLAAGTWTTVALDEGTVQHDLGGLSTGSDYEVRVRNVSPLSARSGWGEVVTVVPEAASTAPGDVTGASVTESNGAALLDWTASAAPYHRARIRRGTTSILADAVVIRHEPGPASAADSYLDQPGSGTWRYWIEAINESGVAASPVGPLELTLA